MSSEIRAAGEWSSPLSVEAQATNNPLGFSQLRAVDGSLYWLEARAAEAGRRVIVRYLDGEQQDVTPAGYSVGSRVHEYGGISYCVTKDAIYFVNQADQNLYKQVLDQPSSVDAITSSSDEERFVDPIFDARNGRLICVRERHQPEQEATNDLIAISLENGSSQVLHEGHDFYSNARLSPSGDRIAFLTWDHPNMPWNGTQLYVMLMDASNKQASIIAGGQEESIFGPEWVTNDLLTYCSDRSGFYGIYAFSDEGSYAVTEEDREYGHAMWQVGVSQTHTLNDQVILATPDAQEIVLLHTFNCIQTPLESGAESYHNTIKYKEGIAFVESNVDAPSAIRFKPTFSSPAETIKSSSELLLDPGCISIPEAIEYTGSRGETVHAYFYPPKNDQFESPLTERPPLLVKAHGGPTGSTSSSLNTGIQFYTSRGWAVLDVNYSGSTGFGRAYRDRLLNEWGNRDVEDLVAGVRYLIANDQIDPLRVAIAGSSAGGYTVLRALTTSSVFKVGASHYGIGDLRALANDTHKFESRYIDQLVPESELDQRSPINHIEALNCPVIFSQGLLDKVVPPNQAERMFEALKNKGIATALLLHPDEHHGFRNLDTVIQTMKADYFFFSRVFKFTPYDIDSSALDGAQLANMDKI